MQSQIIRNHYVSNQFFIGNTFYILGKELSHSSSVIIYGEKRGKLGQFLFHPVSENWMRKKCHEFDLQLVEMREPIDKDQIQSKNVNEHPPNGTAISKDGNCFFRSLSFILTGSQRYHLETRQLICHQFTYFPSKYLSDVMGSNSYLMKVAASAALSRKGKSGWRLWRMRHEYNRKQKADRYIEKMSKLGVWATSREIQAAADILNTTIWCFGPTCWKSYNPMSGSSSDGAIFLINLNKHFEPLCNW